MRAAKRWKCLGAEEVGRSVLRVKMRGPLARIMRTQWLFVFSLHLFTHLVQMVVDQLFLGEDFWAKTSTFSTFRRRKKEEMRFFCKSGLLLISRVQEEVKEKIGFSFTPNPL